MVGQRTLTKAELVRQLKDLGLRNSQIAVALNISRQYVSRVCSKLELSKESCHGASDSRTSRDDKPLTTSEASLLLGVSHNTIRRWSNQGKVPCFRIDIGRRDRRFYYSDLEQLKKCIGTRNQRS